MSKQQIQWLNDHLIKNYNPWKVHVPNKALERSFLYQSYENVFVWLLWRRNWALFSNARYLTDCHMYISVSCFSLIWNLFKVYSHPLWVFSPHFILCISVSKKNQTNINFLKKSKPRKALNHNIIYFIFIESWIAAFITNTFIYQSIQCDCFSPTLLISVFTIFGGF